MHAGTQLILWPIQCSGVCFSLVGLLVGDSPFCLLVCPFATRLPVCWWAHFVISLLLWTISGVSLIVRVTVIGVGLGPRLAACKYCEGSTAVQPGPACVLVWVCMMTRRGRRTVWFFPAVSEAGAFNSRRNPTSLNPNPARSIRPSESSQPRPASMEWIGRSRKGAVALAVKVSVISKGIKQFGGRLLRKTDRPFREVN